MVSRKKVLSIVALIFLVVNVSAFAQRAMSVTVQKVEIRSGPSFLGRIITTLVYGDSVRIRKEQGSWYEITIPGTRDTGWIHSSALTKKRILFAASTAQISTEATSSEVALAGKGFNKEVESQFIEETSYDYTWIDKMESVVIPIDKIRAFLADGGLSTMGGDEE